MVEIDDLTKVYGRTTAVDHLTLTNRPGVVTGFLGPNGAGKSTTMRTIVGLDRLTSGRVLVNGRRYVDSTARCARSARCSTRAPFTPAGGRRRTYGRSPSATA